MLASRCVGGIFYQVNTLQINKEVIRDWVAQRMQELLGIEDDVAVEMIFEYLHEEVKTFYWCL
jgi:hypothetical protein